MNPQSYRSKFGAKSVAQGKGSRGMGSKAWWAKVKDLPWNPIKGLYNEYDGAVPCYGSNRRGHGKFHPLYYKQPNDHTEYVQNHFQEAV